MIDYKQSLNPAQFAAATAKDGPVLVIAGAGSGKTRTIVYRLAWLVEQGIDPCDMLLLTFTRKAAQEMLLRASQLLERGLVGVRGGTFHAFAYSILRQYRPAWLEGRQFSVMDSADISAAIRHCREELKLGKGDRSFPRTQNIVGILSKARNKEISIEEVLQREATHLLPHTDALQALDVAYTNFRRTQGLLDYDDLLFELEAILHEEKMQALRQSLRHIMVDEYQDTNLVQARLVRLLGGKEYGGHGNVMAVGDDAQSIYAFRGANVRNILDFPENFADTKIIRLEENYRSTQAVLDVANTLLSNATESFDKNLFTKREGGNPVRMITPNSDKSQADVVTRRIVELLKSYLPHEIAVLFRAGFHSYNLEVALNRAGIKFRKYGGLRFAEAAHIKDVLAFARLIVNPLDMQAFERVAVLHKGIGKKTMQKLYNVAIQGDAKATEKAFAKYQGFLTDMRFVDNMRELSQHKSPSDLVELIIEHYQPYLEAAYPDDYPRRRQGLDEMLSMAANATHLDLFIADLVLDTVEDEDVDEESVILSTVHSAKGLEWNAVIIIDLVEERFPSRHAMNDAESFEEERRLMYVACTRAKQQLELYAPSSVYTRGSMGSVYASPSPFLRELPRGMCEEWYETYGKILQKKSNGDAPITRLLPPSSPSLISASGSDFLDMANPFAEKENSSPAPADTNSKPLGYCQHKIFGRGKMIKFIPPDKYQVNFAGFGLKVIMQDFLTLE